ncbi:MULTISPECIES: DUF2057 family protein [unclassified Brenneria]|uniref:DUF2057 family protein n=1 Tax=unclassified Brenneria TaxID=2634434 RepID=UPI0018F0C4DB|nr:DUF2057 family protein [Brenneria sp. L3-3C-1]MBJ7221155.1 DUF2057 family protein [Brenneria sp. L3-3C-1]MEE3642397.1 DUF2057 family protein [Brenneria sp. L3_3C_1]
MKFGLVIACFFMTGIGMPAIATTLQLDQNIDLIVVDGKKVSGSLLKGADSLELDNGQHQILFNVVKIINSANGVKNSYRSPALIATFNTENLASVSFKLPSLETTKERKNFDRQTNYQLVDERLHPIPARVDILTVTDDELAHEHDIEKKMSEYNAANHDASVAGLISSSQPTDWAITEDPAASSSSSIISSTLFSIMQYWFQQADKETQQRFLHWVKEKDSH